MTDRTSDSEIRETWESAAPGWAKWEGEFSACLEEATDLLIDLARVKTGARVLDVACGAGSQSIAAAKRVGPSGRVVACDISRTMLEHVRQNAERQGIANIETLECSAEDLPAALTLFDAAICRLGLMLFPSPAKALAAIQRVLRPGARFAALVFTTPANNPFMSQPMRILLRHAGKQPPAPGQPGIFALGADGKLEAVLRDSGLAEVETRTVRAVLRQPSATQVLQSMQQAFGAYRAVVADLSETDRSKAWADVHECLKQFESDSGFEAEFEFVIGSGAKPPQ